MISKDTATASPDRRMKDQLAKASTHSTSDGLAGDWHLLHGHTHKAIRQEGNTLVLRDLLTGERLEIRA